MKTMLLISNTHNPYINHAIEDRLLSLPQPYNKILFLWVNRQSVVLGRNQNPWKEIHVERANQLGVDILRRNSGGGTVYHDLGNLNYAFISYKKNYDELHNFSIIQSALKSYGIQTHIGRRKDIFVSTHKISGSAFYLKKERRLHHGTLLVDVDTNLLWEILKFKSSEIESKSIESKRSDIINLNQINSQLTIQSVIDSVIEAFRKTHDSVEVGDIEKFIHENSFYIKDKADYFSSWQWTYGETPKFKYKTMSKGYLDIRDGKIVATNKPYKYNHLIGTPFNEHSMKTID